MRHNIAFMQPSVQGTGGGQVASVTIDPNDGYIPITVFVSTAQLGAHLFYTLGGTGVGPPTHDGDSATGSTIRIGSYQGSISVTGSSLRKLRILAYEPGYLDSPISEATYEVNTGQ